MRCWFCRTFSCGVVGGGGGRGGRGEYAPRRVCWPVKEKRRDTRRIKKVKANMIRLMEYVHQRLSNQRCEHVRERLGMRACVRACVYLCVYKSTTLSPFCARGAWEKRTQHKNTNVYIEKRETQCRFTCCRAFYPLLSFLPGDRG